MQFLVVRAIQGRETYSGHMPRINHKLKSMPSLNSSEILLIPYLKLQFHVSITRSNCWLARQCLLTSFLCQPQHLSLLVLICFSMLNWQKAVQYLCWLNQFLSAEHAELRHCESHVRWAAEAGTTAELKPALYKCHNSHLDRPGPQVQVVLLCVDTWPSLIR